MEVLPKSCDKIAAVNRQLIQEASLVRNELDQVPSGISQIMKHFPYSEADVPQCQAEGSNDSMIPCRTAHDSEHKPEYRALGYHQNCPALLFRDYGTFPENMQALINRHGVFPPYLKDRL